MLIKLNLFKTFEKFFDLLFFILAFSLCVSTSLEEITTVLIYFFFVFLFFYGRSIFNNIKKINTSFLVSIILLLTGSVLSAVFKSENHIGALKEKFLDFWMIPLFFIIPFWVKEKKKEIFIDCLLLGAFVAACYGILQSFTGWDLFGKKLQKGGELFFATGFTDLHLTYGGLMSLITFVALGFAFQKDISIIKRFFRFAIFLFSVAACWFSFSRSAFTGLIAGSVVFFLRTLMLWKGKKRILLLLFFLILTGMFFTVVNFYPQSKKRMIEFFSFKYISDDIRYDVWRTSFNMAIHNPVLGVGSEKDFHNLYLKYRIGRYRWALPHSHNDILQSWLSGGILGLLGYVLLFGSLFFYGIKSKLKNLNITGLFCSIVAMFIQGLSQCYFTDSENAWLFWVIVGLFFYEIYYQKDEVKV